MIERGYVGPEIARDTPSANPTYIKCAKALLNRVGGRSVEAMDPSDAYDLAVAHKGMAGNDLIFECQAPDCSARFFARVLNGNLVVMDSDFHSDELPCEK